MTTHANYSELSLALTKQINKEEKKRDGIYFTPSSAIHKTLELLEPYMKDIKDVLEPSCGSCEYINALKVFNPNLNIVGIELNKTIYESIKDVHNERLQIYNEDYLSYTTKENLNFDLIIGNPPYFVMKKKDVSKVYHNYFDGRPNIFILFIIKSLELLKENGILSFILPKSFLNCLYYDKTRKYLNKFNILHIVECNNDYMDTEQETVIFIVQKTEHHINKKYCLSNNSEYIYTIFGTPESIVKLTLLYNGSTTLSNLGFTVTVGNVVWNQCKNELTAEKKTLLIYSSNIKDKKLIIKEYSNEEKKNYINKKGDTDPLLVLNRGYGVGKYNFEYCIINRDEDIEYLIENHLICIKYKKNIDKKELICLYDKIIQSFENKKTKEFIQLYFGNNAINTTELCEILPIYI
jgi:adenine-specific DNA-methyltransferase